MEVEKVNKDLGLSGEVKELIDEFISKKRKQILIELYPKRKLSQGELAKAVETSTASLANILLNFESFKYPLLESESEGKRRYYSLSRLGRDYIENCRRQEKKEEKGKIVRDSSQMLQKAKACLGEFQALEENWEFELEEALLDRIECRKIISNESQKAVDEFLKSIEYVLTYDYENQLLNVLRFMDGNKILQVRMSRFIDKFDLFRPVLEAWENGFDALQLYELLDAVISNGQKRGRTYAEALHWTEEYDRLTEGISYVMEKTVGEEMQVLYECFQSYLAGNQVLSGFLAREIYKRVQGRDNT